uniref:hypothetical protein n=1 Tax=Diaphorobacter sp. TaxID=1934310 RepID=UPI00258F4509
PNEIRSVPLKKVLTTPPFLKAATFGTVRDGWLIERLEREFFTLDHTLDGIGITQRVNRGQGFKVKGREQTKSPDDYPELRVVTPDNFTAFRIESDQLDEFTHETLHRVRSRSIFRGPLLLCSKVGSDAAAERGRYSAAVSEEDVLYTQGFFGISFAGVDSRFAFLLSGILNSSLTAFQFAMGGPTWGLERPTVEPHDLLSIRVPLFGQCDPAAIDAVIDAEKSAAANPGDSDRLDRLDDAVFELYGLEPDECILARESVSRARYQIFENRGERIGLVTPPDVDCLHAYAGQVAGSVNAYLRARNERHLEAIVYPIKLTRGDLSAGIPGATAVRFVMASGDAALRHR